MELRHLKYFVTVADELHFGRAADRLHVAQPAVSEQIRRLEAELGVKLLRRSSRAVELTGAGAVLLQDARRLLEQADAAAHAVRRWQRGSDARLRIGYMIDTVSDALPLVLAAWRAQQPALQVELRPGTPTELLADVRSDRLDAAIVTTPAAASGLRTTRAGEEHLVAASAATGSEASRTEAVSIDELAGTPLLMLARERNPACFDAVVAGFHARGLVPAITELDVETLEHVLLEVSAGSGTALVPASVRARLAAPGIVFKPLDASGPTFSLAIVTRDDIPSPTLLDFLRRFSVAVGSAAPRAPFPHLQAA